MSATLGIDTSNYTTSAALYEEGRKIVNCKKLLPVAEGALGLRQSDAVFAHVKQLDKIIAQALQGFSGDITAIGVSDRPRSKQDSYMPCFTVGVSTALSLAAALKVPVYTYSHQQGHIASALYSSGQTDLLGKTFIAFHVSGGTTEVLLVKGNLECEIISTSLDLKIGQAVDRVGNMLGLPFPAGAALDALAAGRILDKKVKVTMVGDNCSVSGLENQCQALYKSGESAENIASYLFAYVSTLVDKLCERAIFRFGELPIVFSGGVMSNSIVRQNILKKYDAFFCEPAFSSDNAAGLAYLAAREKDGFFNYNRITT